MPIVDVTVQCPVQDSFRVQQVAGMFDVPLAERAVERFAVEVPGLEENWQIGLITGPSGSGKTTVAKAVFGKWLAGPPAWPTDAAVIDGFGDLPAKQVTGLLTAVGFSSPPGWIKPYHVLSGGERFRCDLARSLALAIAGRNSADTQPPLVVVDEFTSVVDRDVAKIGSAAVAKAIRTGRAACRLVAISCHADIRDWLEADWVVDMSTCTFQRRRLRRPSIRLEVFRCRHAAWSLFGRHHYLSGSLSRSARCFVGLWEGKAVSFCATMPIIGRKRHWRITRMVTLPDYQGIGIGMRFVESVCRLHRDEDLRISLTTSHPAVVAHCRQSNLWRLRRMMKHGSRSNKRFNGRYCGSRGRAVVSFEFGCGLQISDCGLEESRPRTLDSS